MTRTVGREPFNAAVDRRRSLGRASLSVDGLGFPSVRGATALSAVSIDRTFFWDASD